MTVKKHTPSGAQSSTSARTKKQPANPKAEGTKGNPAQIEAEAEAFKREAIEYARKAYDAALDHYHANQANPFALSRLAVVYEEQEPGAFNMVITLPGWMRDRAISDDSLHKWLARVEMLCRTLEHPNCSDAFRSAFGAVFTEDILDSSQVTWTTPTVVRVMLPLALMEMVRNCDGVPEQFLAIFETLREALNDTATAEEVRASVVGV